MTEQPPCLMGLSYDNKYWCRWSESADEQNGNQRKQFVGWWNRLPNRK